MVRAQAVLLRDGRILMARHQRSEHSYWVLPGGEIEPGEEAVVAAVREVLEETGLEIRVERLLFVDGPRSGPGVTIKRPRHTFLGVIVGGWLECRPDGEGHPEKGRLAEAEWMDFDDARFDPATRDTLKLVRSALDSPAGRGET
jgi:ADP-ribose pyrophosphatase YjhB (NUDIX family)